MSPTSLGYGIRLTLTHEQIAKLMGSAREVVTRMLKYFSQEAMWLSQGEASLFSTKKRSENWQIRSHNRHFASGKSSYPLLFISLHSSLHSLDDRCAEARLLKSCHTPDSGAARGAHIVLHLTRMFA